MIRLLSRGTAIVLISALLAVPTGPGAAAHAATGTLITTPFVEDFDGPAGARPNPDYWVADVGSSAEFGWEDGSLETYTDAVDNLRLDGRGHLVVQARNDGEYTSARLTTRGKLDFPFGTITARMKLPTGQGIWPAFWMLGSNAQSAGWPQCGEIDIIELAGEPTRYHVAVHAPGANSVSSGPIADLSRDFHSYWMTRRVDSVTIGIDDRQVKTFTPTMLLPGPQWVFNDPMFVLINVAVGGTWPGPPDDTTPFPATMLVDWLRFEPLTMRG